MNQPSKRRRRSGLGVVALVLLPLLGMLTGCPPQRPPVAPPPPTAVTPSYEELAGRYNRRLASLQRLWSRATVEAHWLDDKGKKHSEQAEGNLIVALPGKTSLSLGKLGNTMFWAGSDGQLYWLLDLRDDEQKAYVGRAGGPAGGLPGPVPVRPGELPALLGLMPLPLPGSSSEPITFIEGGYLVQPAGTGLRLLIDPNTFQPRQIASLDESGKARILAELSKPEPVTLVGRSPGDFPPVASRVHITLIEDGSTMTLHLSALSDDPEKINENVFALPYLLKAMHIAPAAVVDLDQQAARR